MKRLCFGMLLMVSQITFTHGAIAGDYEWMDNMNVTAQADSSGFRLRLATRFHLGDAEVSAVIGSVDRMADAYMVLRYGELCRCPVDKVINVYKSDGKKGWGLMAKQLGIKPGSSEFHALKNGHDLYDKQGRNHHHPGGKGNGKNNGINKGKDKH
jgi:hypothetical protein